MEEKKDLKYISKIQKKDIVTDKNGFRVCSIDESYKIPQSFINDVKKITNLDGSIEYNKGLNWRANYPIKWTDELIEQVFRLFIKYAKKVGGRPKSESKRSKRVTILFNEKEYCQLKKIVEKSGGIEVSTLIRTLLFENKIPLKYEDKNSKELVFQLTKIGNNINQIAYYFNVKKTLNPVLTIKQINELNKIKELLENIFNKLD